MIRRRTDFQGEQRIGDYRVICDLSGWKVWNSDCVVQWNGLKVYRRFADLFRQPQDFVRAIPDFQNVPMPRPGGPDVFVEPGDVTPGSL